MVCYNPVLAADHKPTREERDPVGKAERSESARAEKRDKTTPDGWPVHSIETLLADLAARCKNTCRAGEGKLAMRFEQITEPTSFQTHVYKLLGVRL